MLNLIPKKIPWSFFTRYIFGCLNFYDKGLTLLLRYVIRVSKRCIAQLGTYIALTSWSTSERSKWQITLPQHYFIILLFIEYWFHNKFLLFQSNCLKFYKSTRLLIFNRNFGILFILQILNFNCLKYSKRYIRNVKFWQFLT